MPIYNIEMKNKPNQKQWVKIKEKEKIRNLLWKEKDSKIKLRFSSLNLIGNYKMNVESVSNGLGIPTQTIYTWIKIWDNEGYEGIKGKPPSLGRPPRLNEKDLEILKGYLKEEKQYWTTKEVIALIKERFGIEIKENRVREILRDTFKMILTKPYPKDYRKPLNAKEMLRKGLEVIIKIFKRNGLKNEDVAIGFLDESSPQLTANTVRVWSFNKIIITKNTSKIKANTIGFYAIKGKSVSSFLSSSKAIDISRFLEKIKFANQKHKAIITILDNFPSHKSKKVRQKAEECGIIPLFLPPYSPDLNPIEFIWKSIKRIISIKFIKNTDELKNLIEVNFMVFSQNLSYAKNWIREFKIDLSPV